MESVNLDDDDDIISIDASPVKVMRPSEPLSNLNRPGLQISRGKSNSDEGVDPLSLDNVSKFSFSYLSMTLDHFLKCQIFGKCGGKLIS